jgi:hypothetical protein
MFDFRCPVCGQSIRCKDEAAGQRGTCPTCNKVITIPDPALQGLVTVAEPEADGRGPKPDRLPIRYLAAEACAVLVIAGGFLDFFVGMLVAFFSIPSSRGLSTPLLMAITAVASGVLIVLLGSLSLVVVDGCRHVRRMSKTSH